MSQTERLGLHPPSLPLRILERLGLLEVKPSDITARRKVGELYARYPDLLGDGTAIGPSDDGRCQSWRNHPGWWRELVYKERFEKV